MDDCAVLTKNGKIADVFSEARFRACTFPPDVEVLDAHGLYLAPGLIDTHIHGFKGFGTDACSKDAMLSMSRELAQYGVTAFIPTLYPDSEEKMIAAISEIVSAMGNETGARIMGIHLEGPFISTQKIGVLKKEFVRDVDLQLMERLWQASRGHIVNMTVAPELKHMRQLALSCIEKGIVLQAGHTDASYSNMVEGMQAGIFHATHLFNAMSQMHHRNPGAVGAVLIHPEMTCEVIADGVHVHPDLFKLLQKDKPSGQIILITDALSPTELYESAEPKTANALGAQNPPTACAKTALCASNATSLKAAPEKTTACNFAPCALFADGEEVVFKDGCFHRKSDDVIAGSALTMIRGVKNLCNFGFPLSEAIKCATANPARVMKFEKQGMIVPGFASDIILFDDDFSVKFVMIAGRIAKNICNR